MQTWPLILLLLLIVWSIFIGGESQQRNNFTNKNLQIIYQAADSLYKQETLEKTFRQSEKLYFGQVNRDCLTYAQYYDKIQNQDNHNIIILINQASANIRELEFSNNTIRSHYDSTLSEKITDEQRKNLISLIHSEKIGQKLNENTAKTAVFNKEITRLEQKLLTKPESINFLDFINRQDV